VTASAAPAEMVNGVSHGLNRLMEAGGVPIRLPTLPKWANYRASCTVEGEVGIGAGAKLKGAVDLMKMKVSGSGKLALGPSIGYGYSCQIDPPK